ncbi:MAG TPA: HD domain-containing protein [Ktedonobacterales bacterium]|nr:HD domain-containing protein [Ktedonobacterales bacterium]
MDEPLPLPPPVSDLLARLGAPARLNAHLTLVHTTACAIITRFDIAWPDLAYAREAVRFGAAIHDIGKIVFPNELTGPGREHEAAGVSLLRAHGIAERLARFAQTHGQWGDDSLLEDLLVALADHWWRGKRAERLESLICRQIAQQREAPIWQVFMTLDDIAADVTRDADQRLLWQNQHPA